MPTPRKKPATDKPTAEKKAPATKRAAKAAPKADAPVADDAAPAAGGKYQLVVVESPAKAKTINKYLGPGYRVLASYGHVRDLPTRKEKGEEVAGIRIADGWKMRYVVDDGSKDEAKGGRGKRRSPADILAEIKREASKADRVLLASDPDREGEAIAWHIADALKLPSATTFRIRFNEITKTAIQAAIASPEKINTPRVLAQEARRAMDRVVGFPLSNLLGKKVAGGLSAGRVQSVAVKLIVDREREIEAFRTEEYWKITALLAKLGLNIPWNADPKKSKMFAKKKEATKLTAKVGDEPDVTPDPDEPVVDTETSDAPLDAEGAAAAPVERTGLPTPPDGSFLAELVKWNGAEPKLANEAAADAVLASLAGASFVVSKREEKDRQDRPSPPFITSTLQQQANIRLRFATSRTMQAAQKLYEGVELPGKGQIAFITYMRTDSTRVSADALTAVRSFIPTEYGPKYLPTSANMYASSKNAQEGHEAIRPTDVTMTPAKAKDAGLGGDQLKLYELIWRRFVASQCTPALMAVTTVEVTAGQGLFRANGRIMKFDGHRRVLTPIGKGEDVTLPDVKERDALNRLDMFEAQHFTQPPARFNEGSLVKMLEKEGIGRPSTYASIIGTIQRRGYVQQEKGRFFATEIGKVVTDMLVKHFPKIMDVKFTSGFEDQLDGIETDKTLTEYRKVLDGFWTPFSTDLKKADTEMAPARVELDEKCPKCGRTLEKRFTTKTGGYFIGCTGWKDKEKPCAFKRSADGKEIAGPTVTDIKCPACGKFMVRKEGRFGVFFTCEGAPDCPTTMNQGADGKPVVTALPTKNKCPKCEKQNLLLKESKAGKKYVQCPDAKCKFISDCDAEGHPIKPPDTGIACEKCSKPMVIKVAWRGPFLSCSGYPQCRNAKSINAELREKLKDLLPPPTEKTEKKDDLPKVQIDDTCPECDSSMRLMKSRFGAGFYLGCSKYPKCKGKGQVSGELKRKIDAAMAAPVAT